ncbi:MAG: hypothetical protein FWE40_08925 [Oscillospiraceae bacterium]|nr:hypothetical protein [Oscillospiraceae bacterium]
MNFIQLIITAVLGVLIAPAFLIIKRCIEALRYLRLRMFGKHAVANIEHVKIYHRNTDLFLTWTDESGTQQRELEVPHRIINGPIPAQIDVYYNDHHVVSTKPTIFKWLTSLFATLVAVGYFAAIWHWRGSIASLEALLAPFLPLLIAVLALACLFSLTKSIIGLVSFLRLRKSGQSANADVTNVEIYSKNVQLTLEWKNELGHPRTQRFGLPHSQIRGCIPEQQKIYYNADRAILSELKPLVWSIVHGLLVIVFFIIYFCFFFPTQYGG